MTFSMLLFTAITTQMAGATQAPPNNDAVRLAAFKVIQKRVPIEKFKPSTEVDVTLLRHERNGVVDFVFKSKDGSYIGNAYCQYSELLKYSEKYTNADSACFRINISEYTKDQDSINGMGKQIGIY